MSKRRLIVALDVFLLVIIVVVAGRLALSQINKQSSGSISVGKPIDSTQISYQINLTPKTVKGAVAAFSVPEGMTLRTPQPLAGSEVEVYTYTARDVSSWTLGIEVDRTTSGQLSSNTSYMLRKNNPEQYAASQETVNGSLIYIMTDKTAPDFTEAAFFTHGTFVATVSLTGDDASGSAPLQTTLNMVLSSWSWLI